MADKEKFLADIRDILREKTFRNEEWLNKFSQDLWYVKDYLRGYFTGESRPKGRWCMEDINDDCIGYFCSNCLEEGINGANFCPHCGADMRVDLAENVK